MTNQTTHHHCDKCGKKLKSCDNNVVIMTEGSINLSHLRVIVEYRYGRDDKQPADLCQSCAATLFADAARRVRSGERATAGTESAVEGTFVK